MSRPGDFSKFTVEAALSRQNGKCGICGQKLYQTGMPYQGHHIRSGKYGGSSSINNCVVLCTDKTDGDQGCHLFAHGDYYHRTFELDPSFYVYYNGTKK